MNTITALRLDRDRDLTADIVPEMYLKSHAIREFSYPWVAQVYERQFTEARAAWSDKYLYVHLWAKDSWVVGKETKAKGPVYKDDCLEVFVQPEAGRYWGWEVNPLGTCLDYRAEGWGSGPVEDRHIEVKTKTTAQWKVRRHDAGWVFEIRIPFLKEFGKVPRRGDAWRITFNRLDLDRQGRQTLSTFSDLSADSPVWFHQPGGFGQILFG